MDSSVYGFVNLHQHCFIWSSRCHFQCAEGFYGIVDKNKDSRTRYDNLDDLDATVCRRRFCADRRLCYHGGLLPAFKTDQAQPAYFVWALAFVAGFSERLVMHAVSAATRSNP